MPEESWHAREHWGCLRGRLGLLEREVGLYVSRIMALNNVNVLLLLCCIEHGSMNFHDSCKVYNIQANDTDMFLISLQDVAVFLFICE